MATIKITLSPTQAQATGMIQICWQEQIPRELLGIYFKNEHCVADNWKLRSELRAVKDTNGIMGHSSCATFNVRWFAFNSSRVQSNFAKQKNYCCRSGSIRWEWFFGFYFQSKNNIHAGIQGRRIYKHKGIEIWSRPITPIFQTYYSYAIAFVNRRTDGTPSDVAVTLRELGLQSPTGYRVEVSKI